MERVRSLDGKRGGRDRVPGPKAFVVWLSLAAIWFPGVLVAQVNTEQLVDPVDAPGLSGHVGLDLAARSGNVELISVRTDIVVQYATGPGDPETDETEDAEASSAAESSSSEAEDGGDETEGSGQPAELTVRDIYLLVVNQEFAEASRQNIANQAFGFASWTRLVTPGWGVTLIGQIEYDDFTLLDRRIVVGSAVRFRRWPSEGVGLEFATGYEYEQERLDVPLDGPDEPEQTNHRWVNFFVAGFELVDGRVSISNTLFYLPRFDEPSDFRVLDEAEVLVDITDRLALGVTFRLRHDSRPPTSVEETDLALASRLRYRF